MTTLVSSISACLMLKGDLESSMKAYSKASHIILRFEIYLLQAIVSATKHSAQYRSALDKQKGKKIV